MIDSPKKMINVCDSIKCPFGAKRNGSFFCHKYLVAVHCHLLQTPDGLERTELKRSSTQYYLYTYPGKVDLDELAQQNAEFLASPEIIEDLAIEAELGT
jgi:hypothetical protein